MEITLTLALPRDGLSVPVARRVLSTSLTALGVVPQVVSDIEVALTEACTNVLDHAADGDDYVVSAGIDGSACVIEVLDRGGGFEAALLGHGDAEEGAESGRGIQLMRALVDRVHFDRRTTDGEVGSVVHLEKRLTWDSGSPLARLEAGRRRAAADGDGEPLARR